MLCNLLCSVLLISTIARSENDWRTDEDLASFVSRPELKPPRFNVTVHDAKRISPGYWFLAPYAQLGSRLRGKEYEPDQIGPSIYDNQGELIWSGASLFRGRTICDFRAFSHGDSQGLSLIVYQDKHSIAYEKGVGIILDNAYEILNAVEHDTPSGFNMHEFNLINEGKSALIVTHTPRFSEHPGVWGDEPSGWLGVDGFEELDVATGEAVFTWFGLDHIHPSEALVKRPDHTHESHAWDYLHMNSVDKNADGDYLISSKHTSTIYKISGSSGSVIWRLGGAKSSFTQQDFNFSSQHDARFHSSNSTHSIISFLDNASDQYNQTSTYSSALVIALNTVTWTATVIGQYDRPDHQLSQLRGNVQILPNSNVFVGWSENGYQSEFTAGGDLVLEARWTSHRYVNYRAYKFNFTGKPTEPPTLKGFVYGTSAVKATTVQYVSWNGATEVSEWNFYGSTSTGFEVFEVIGRMRRTAFESMLMVEGYYAYVFAEAVAADGRSLGNSTVQRTIVPATWNPEGCEGEDLYECRYFPDQPTTTFAALGARSGGSRHLGLVGILVLVSLVVLGYYARRKARLPAFLHRSAIQRL